MRKIMLTVLACLPLILSAQSGLPGHFFKGYARSVRGGGFEYHSPQPGVTTSLLIRSIDSAQYIEWETEVIPPGFREKGADLVWMFGIDANTDSHSFRLFVNGRQCLTFTNPLMTDPKPWRADGKNGVSLFFRTTMIDKYGDPMGYAVLHMPAEMLKPGSPQVIRIVGESKESRSWYMTFEAGVEESLTVDQEPALVRGKNGGLIPVLFQFVHLGEPAKGSLDIPGGPRADFTLETGFNEVRVLMPGNTTPGEKTATIRIQGQPPVKKNFAISPFRHFTIFLVEHAHTDIGYTRPQTEILPDHLRYIDYALDFCDLTDTLPDDAKFRWTCETSWAVREYLRTRPPSQVERLKRRVAEGRIEITGLFLNSSDLADEATVAATLQPVGEFREMGFPVRAAMQDDINGVPWCLADYLPAAGISYLNMGQNATRALRPFSRPTTFWWESPSGSRLLVNRPEHYMFGNSLGILSTMETFGKNLFRHLADIREKGYPYNEYAIQFSGYLTDNSPPSTTACKLVEEWNKTYEWPRLRLATISQFLEIMKTEHGNELPVIRGAWPDWWMDGFGSAANQTAHARAAHSESIANQGLMSIASFMGIAPNPHVLKLRKEIDDDLAFYDEHTFGAAESITDPLCENSVVQLAEKESYVWSAVKKNRICREELMGEVQPLLSRSDVPTITVFNTLNWNRSGNVTVYIDQQLLPKERKFRIVDGYGNEVAATLLSSREEGAYWMLHLRDVPALGFTTCRILVSAGPAGAMTDKAFDGILENEYYRMEIDGKTGNIIRLYDKEWRRELIDTAAPYKLGEFIYERLGKNRGQLEQLRLDEYTRKTWENVHPGRMTDGNLWRGATLTGRMPGCAADPGVRCEIRMYLQEKKIEFCYSMIKEAVTDPEGVYVAFPFKLKGSHPVVEVAGGAMAAGREQIEGSASDWTGIQDYVSLRSDSGQIVLVSPEIPLVQLGAINLGKFYRVPTPGPSPDGGSPTPGPSPDGGSPTPGPSPDGEGRLYPASGNIYSWVLNNYWTTNFLACQEGEMKWTYQLTSGADPSGTAAKRFGMENRVPMLCRVAPPAVNAGKEPASRSFFPGCSRNLVLVSARPSGDGRGVLLQMRETAGKRDSLAVSDVASSGATLAPSMQAKSVAEVNVLEKPVRAVWPAKDENPARYNPARIYFKPFETKFILVQL